LVLYSFPLLYNRTFLVRATFEVCVPVGAVIGPGGRPNSADLLFSPYQPASEVTAIPIAQFFLKISGIKLKK
jgi:hypothetical protein